MKGRIVMFFSNLALYCIIFLVWNKFDLTSKQIAEMIFMGTFSSIAYLLMLKPMTRLMQSALRKVGMGGQDDSQSD